MRLLVLLSLLTSAACAKVKVVAYVGEPFGVAEITVSGSDVPYDSNKYSNNGTYGSIYEQMQNLGSRAFYPVASQHVVEGQSANWTVRFLFRGDESLEVNTPWRGRKRNKSSIRPIDAPERHQMLLKKWHADLVAQATLPLSKRRYPAVVDTYLASMLSRRLSLPPPGKPKATSFGDQDFDEFIGFMTGTEAIRTAIQRDALLNTKAESKLADQPLPKPVTPPPVEIPEVDASTKIEPLSLVVPHECFYARFGSFKSFMWFRDRVDQWGGDLRDLTSVRGLDYGLTERLQTQLALPDTELSRLLGPTAISDVAIIGQDTFIREGAAVGVLFQATNDLALTTSINAQRQAVANGTKDVVLEDVKPNGFLKTVSFLHSKDNRIRSFYVRHESFHLVTTSSNIARRFLECAMQKKDSLGASNEFLHARTIMPLAKDSIFLYLSDAFIRTFVEPHYRIEMTRRARSDGEIELVQVAQLAAKAEGKPHATLKELIEGQFLPVGFDSRADGSQLIPSDGRWIDSVRGRRGSFLPIADTSVEKATREEVDAYDKFARSYRRLWRAMDPAMVSIQRVSNGKTERLKFHLHVYPIPSGDFWWLGFLNANEEKQETLSGEKGIPFLAEVYWGGGSQPIVIGLFDAPVPFVIKDGDIDPSDVLEHDDWFVTNLGTSAENSGISESTGPLSGLPGWVFQSDAIELFSRSKEQLEKFGPKLGFKEANSKAKVRVRIGDLSKSQLTGVLNAGGWLESKKVVAGNVKWLNKLSSQLHVRKHACLNVSKQILNAELSNPLGRGYARDAGLYYSNKETTRAKYVLPLLQWFSRGTLELDSTRDTLTSRGEVWLRGLERADE